MSLDYSSAKRAGTKVYLNSRQVCARYGNVSDMTIYRWQNDPALNFPIPLKIKDRRYWDGEQLDQFDAERIADSGEAM